MLCIAGIDGYFKHLNPAWEKTLGYSKEELLSHPYVDFVHPEDRDATIAEASSLAAGRDTFIFENRYRCKDGSYKWLRWTGGVRAEKGVIYASARDISPRKREEARLAAQHAVTRVLAEAPNSGQRDSANPPSSMRESRLGGGCDLAGGQKRRTVALRGGLATPFAQNVGLRSRHSRRALSLVVLVSPAGSG